MSEHDKRYSVVAVTGATGFIGGAILRRLARAGKTVRVLARNPDKLNDETRAAQHCTIIKGDLDDQAALDELIAGADALVHCAGVVTPRVDDDYQRVNVAGAERAAKTARMHGAAIVHLSSLSAREPHLSPYAGSKNQSETVVGKTAVSLRLPAIYGPGDMVTLPYFKMVARGIAPEPATRNGARVSILYVEDAVDAVLAALGGAVQPGVYEVADDSRDGYPWRALGATLGLALGVRPRSLRIPRFLLAAAYAAKLRGARITGTQPSVRTGQINEFFHPDWVARNALFNVAAGWTPRHTLQEGFAKTVQWYQKNNYL